MAPLVVVDVVVVVMALPWLGFAVVVFIGLVDDDDIGLVMVDVVDVALVRKGRCCSGTGTGPEASGRSSPPSPRIPEACVSPKKEQKSVV